MTDAPEVAAARIAVERSRARVMATAQELQERLSPKTLARTTWQGVKEKGAEAAEDAVDAVRARPIAASSVVAAVATTGRRSAGRRRRTRWPSARP